jgi:hypothetical protein
MVESGDGTPDAAVEWLRNTLPRTPVHRHPRRRPLAGDAPLGPDRDDGVGAGRERGETHLLEPRRGSGDSLVGPRVAVVRSPDGGMPVDRADGNEGAGELRQRHGVAAAEAELLPRPKVGRRPRARAAHTDVVPAKGHDVQGTARPRRRIDPLPPRRGPS